MRGQASMALLLSVLVGACGGGDDTAPTEQGSEFEDVFPLPDDLADRDWEAVFPNAVDLLVSVNVATPWRGHRSVLETRELGCPDFWSGPFTVGLQTVGYFDGVAWYDDCETVAGDVFDGWLWWDSTATESGDPNSKLGRTADASRRLEGDAVVTNDKGVRFEFEGEATDALTTLQATGFDRFTYSTSIEATVTGADVFGNSSIPDGFRTDLFMFVSGGDVEVFEARGNVYLFTPQLLDQYDSIQADLVLFGDVGAAPGDCTLEPRGWIGVRDPEAIWYDVVFQPRAVEDVAGEPYPNKPLSACDGCGQLYVQGIPQEDIEVCIDFSFLFDAFPVPNPDDYVLPIHAL